MNIQFKETILDTFIRSTEGCMKNTSFFLPVDTQTPLIDLTNRRLLCGWEITKLPGLLYKATKGDVTLRFYPCTGEWVVNLDDIGKQFDFDNGADAKNKIRKWLNENREKQVNS